MTALKRSGFKDKKRVHTLKGKTQRKAVALTLSLLTGLAGLGFTGCASAPQPVRIAVSPLVQDQILGEMVRVLLEKNGEECEVIEVPSGIKSIYPAMVSGQLDITPMQTSAAWSYLLKEDTVFDNSQFEQMEQDMEKEGLVWDGMLGFQSGTSLAIRKDLAQEYDIQTLSDLKEIASSLTLGTDSGFLEREDGMPALQDTYDLSFKKTVILPEDMLYMRLKDGQIDLMPVELSDGRLPFGNMIYLQDNFDAFGDNAQGFILRQKIEEEVPVLREILMQLQDSMTLQDMQELNGQVLNEKLTVEKVVENYLNATDMI